MYIIILSEHDAAILVQELSQQGTSRDFQVAIINFSVRSIVNTIVYFKLQIVTIQILFVHVARRMYK
jgi:hypothetical protein